LQVTQMFEDNIILWAKYGQNTFLKPETLDK